MSNRFSRRQVLGGALCVGVSAGLPWPAGAATAALQVVAVAEGLWLIRGAGGNATLVQGSEGGLLIDGGAAQHSKVLLARARELTAGRPVQWLVNTHCHPDQTGSNEALGRAGARILAHANTRLWLGRPLRSAWQGLDRKALPPQALPNQVVHEDSVLRFGSHDLRLTCLFQAHTDGDLAVHLPAHDLLVVADVLGVGAYPLPDPVCQGWIGGLVDATAALLKACGPSTTVIAGQGAPQRREDLQAQYDMLVTVRDRLFALVKQGKSPTEILAAAPTREFDGRWGDPELFLRLAAQGIAARARLVGGVV